MESRNDNLTDIVVAVTSLIMKEFDASPREAMLSFYASPTYRALESGDSVLIAKTAKEIFEDYKRSTGR